VISHHDIQLASSALLIDFYEMENQKSFQANSQRSIPVKSTEFSGPDIHRAVEDYRVKNILLITGQPDQRLSALLSILLGYEASLHD
jgi:hypothetical protein